MDDQSVCQGYLTLMSFPDLSSPYDRFKVLWSYFWGDHAFLRLSFTNAHWVDAQMVRSNQPSPRQLRWWKRQGIRTVINLRGPRNEAYYWLEKDACQKLGLTLINAPLDSRDAPTLERVMQAKHLFETIEYPVLIHCKSGADRVGLMAALYRYFHLGQPMAVAKSELGRRTLHNREGKTGVLDMVLETYASEAEPQGTDLISWMQGGTYDPCEMTRTFRSKWWGDLLVERLLCRE